MSGVKGENSIKLFGDDLEKLEATANQITQVMKTVPGVVDLGILSELGQPNLLIQVDRQRAARYGVAPGDVNATVQAAIGGEAGTPVLGRQPPLSRAGSIPPPLSLLPPAPLSIP